MAGYIHRSKILQALPGLEPNSSNDLKDDAIDREINSVAREMRESQQNYDLSVLSLHQADLLAGINEFLPEARIILRRSVEVSSELVKYARVQEAAGRLFLKWYRLGKFRESFQGEEDISRIELTTIEECCELAGDFEPASEAETDREQKSYPSIEAIRDWVRYRSAMVYSLASTQSYPTPAQDDIDELTDDQLDAYATPVRLIVGSQIVRVLKAQYSKNINLEADELLRLGLEKFKDLAGGKNFESFSDY
jgi:hypothetical protein